jgi:ADP-heptose:LPS heptosyltransferase
VEITKEINKYSIVSEIVSLIFNTFFFAVRKLIKPFVNKSGNIVIISFCKLGDTVFTTPAISEIQKFYKKTICVVCYPESVPIYNLVLNNIKFLQIDRGHFLFGGRIADFYSRKVFAELNPEIIFDLNGVMTSATLIFNSRAKSIIGMSRKQFRAIYDHYLPINRKNHLMDMYLSTVASVIPISDKESIKYFPNKFNSDEIILIHPFAGWKAKEWNLKKFIELTEEINKYYNISVIIQSGSIPNDILDELDKKGIDFLETNSVDELIIHIKECSVFIGNDSGPIHIANLLGKPTFSLFGPTNPKFAAPLGDYNEYTFKVVKCSPRIDEEFCFTNGGRDGCPSFECMNQLSVGKVKDALFIFLEKIKIQKKYHRN